MKYLRDFLEKTFKLSVKTRSKSQTKILIINKFIIIINEYFIKIKSRIIF